MEVYRDVEHGKITCRRAAKHTSKRTCEQHDLLGQLLEAEACKKRTPLRCEPHFEFVLSKREPLRAYASIVVVSGFFLVTEDGLDLGTVQEHCQKICKFDFANLLARQAEEMVTNHVIAADGEDRPGKNGKDKKEKKKSKDKKEKKSSNEPKLSKYKGHKK